MSRSDVEDPKLAEVKAILARLQRISPDDQLTDASSTATATLPAAAIASTVARSATTPPPLPITRQAPPSGRRLPLAALAAGAATAAVVVALTRPLWQTPVAQPVPQPVPQAIVSAHAPAVAVTVAPAPQPAPTPPAAAAPPEKPSLGAADRLIRGGRLVEGRAGLLQLGAETSADVAWALARTFDPNVVDGIAGADAKPDVAEAERWYRRWHALAQAEGLVSDGVPVERVIKAMKR